MFDQTSSHLHAVVTYCEDLGESRGLALYNVGGHHPISWQQSQENKTEVPRERKDSVTKQLSVLPELPPDLQTLAWPLSTVPRIHWEGGGMEEAREEWKEGGREGPREE